MSLIDVIARGVAKVIVGAVHAALPKASAPLTTEQIRVKRSMKKAVRRGLNPHDSHRRMENAWTKDWMDSCRRDKDLYIIE